MDARRSLRWAVYYVVLAGVATLLAAAVAGAGVVVGIAPAYEQLDSGVALSDTLRTAAPGFALVLLGAILWVVGIVAAFVRVFTAAVEEQMRDRFDSEKVKSEILSVLDDRLSDVEHDISEMRRTVGELKREDAAEEFQFGQD